jgi:hypothetical protein
MNPNEFAAYTLAVEMGDDCESYLESLHAAAEISFALEADETENDGEGV